MPAVEAQPVGLVHRICPNHEAMLAGVMEVAADIASKAPLTTYGNKRIMTYS
jgi:enoyl-CoA hydratase